jgi:hypothetical protein
MCGPPKIEPAAPAYRASTYQKASDGSADHDCPDAEFDD